MSKLFYSLRIQEGILQHGSGKLSFQRFKNTLNVQCVSKTWDLKGLDSYKLQVVLGLKVFNSDNS